MEGTCLRCKRIVLLSNLISGTFCLECQERSLQYARKLVKFMNYFGTLYKFLLLISGLIGIVFMILNPASFGALFILMIITIFFTVVSILGMLPHIFPTFSETYLEEMMIKLNDQLSKYSPQEAAYCVYHSEREADGRCGNCYEPFCAEHLIYIFGKPSTCQNCGQKYTANFNFWPTLNGVLSISLLSGIGIYNEIMNLQGFGFSIVFLICLFIEIFVVVMLRYYYRTVSSQLEKTTQDYNI